MIIKPLHLAAFSIFLGLSLMAIGSLEMRTAMAQDEPKDQTRAPPDSQPAPSPTPTAPPVRFYLELEQQDLNAISTALMELPKKIADPLILKLNGQLQKQDDIRTSARRSEEEAREPKGKKRK